MLTTNPTFNPTATLLIKRQGIEQLEPLLPYGLSELEIDELRRWIAQRREQIQFTPRNRSRPVRIVRIYDPARLQSRSRGEFQEDQVFGSTVELATKLGMNSDGVKVVLSQAKRMGRTRANVYGMEIEYAVI